MAANDPSADLDYLDEYDPARGIPFSSHLLAGSVAGLAEHLLVFPLDTLKTNAQCVGACGRAQGPDVLCLRAAKRLAADGIQTGSGARRLFRGVGAVTVACVPAHAMYFGAFEVVRGADAGGVPSHATNALAGAVAVVGHDCVMTPADVIKQRLQLGHHRGLRDAWRATLAGGGLASLYRSLPTTLAMNVPYGCFSVAANEALKGWLTRRNGQAPGLGGLLACGGAAGAVASLLTTPLDVIKTRLQTQDLSWARHASVGAAGADPGRRGLASMAAPAEPVAYRGFADAARGIWTADGAVGFYRGAAVRALAQAPSVAIVWTTYELLVRALAA
mmetsp:Transcript_11129/g.34244  ORF Transcript_11129/g.34244 Transcript_11129/m.34244 type:complete len:332 (-) Transcript_11129:39-1034(-)